MITDEITAIADWTLENIEYRTDAEEHGCPQYWAPPSETLASRRGDCINRAIVFAHLVHGQLGLKGYFITSENPASPTVGHCTVAFSEIPGRLWLTGEREMPWKVRQVFDYDTMMEIAETSHGRDPFLPYVAGSDVLLRDVSIDWMLDHANTGAASQAVLDSNDTARFMASGGYNRKPTGKVVTIGSSTYMETGANAYCDGTADDVEINATAAALGDECVALTDKRDKSLHFYLKPRKASDMERETKRGKAS
jgi:hypothetical protein